MLMMLLIKIQSNEREESGGHGVQDTRIIFVCFLVCEGLKDAFEHYRNRQDCLTHFFSVVFN
jgi:hypothetical protein